MKGDFGKALEIVHIVSRWPRFAATVTLEHGRDGTYSKKKSILNRQKRKPPIQQRIVSG
jgi:hypothetical protein